MVNTESDYRGQQNASCADQHVVIGNGIVPVHRIDRSIEDQAAAVFHEEIKNDRVQDRQRNKGQVSKQRGNGRFLFGVLRERKCEQSQRSEGPDQQDDKPSERNRQRSQAGIGRSGKGNQQQQ